MFLFDILCSLFVGGKHVSSKLRNLPMFDATCLLYGRLNHVMLLFLLFFVCVCCFDSYFCGVCILICSHIHFFFFFFFFFGGGGIFVRWNCLFQYTFIGMFDSVLLVLSGMFLMIFGGWLLFCVLVYKGVLVGFMYGLCSPVLKSIVMLRKSTIKHSTTCDSRTILNYILKIKC